jgi:hypothetical protein
MRRSRLPPAKAPIHDGATARTHYPHLCAVRWRGAHVQLPRAWQSSVPKQLPTTPVRSRRWTRETRPRSHKRQVGWAHTKHPAKGTDLGPLQTHSAPLKHYPAHPHGPAGATSSSRGAADTLAWKAGAAMPTPLHAPAQGRHRCCGKVRAWASSVTFSVWECNAAITSHTVLQQHRIKSSARNCVAPLS